MSSRRTLSLSLVGLVAGAALLTQAPAHAQRVEATARADRAGLTCLAGLGGMHTSRRMHYYDLKNGKVTKTYTSKNKLNFEATAWGYFDSVKTKTGRVLRLDTVAGDGVPRQVAATFKGSSLTLASAPYAQGNFRPDLFADSLGYYAYTIKGDSLQRWSLTRKRNGQIKFAQRITLGTGFKNYTSLQATSIFTIKSAKKEVLYATTDAGALMQLVIPLKRPTKIKIRTLATSGYEDVTELAWSICNDKLEYHYLVAVSPSVQSATWTTIRNATTKPTSVLQGPITGGDDFDLVTAF